VTITVRAVAETAFIGVLLTVFAMRHGMSSGDAAVLSGAAVVTGLASTVAHELGHAVVARRYGLAVLGLRIEGLLGGGLERERSDRPDVERRTSLAGPAVTLLLAATGGALALAGARYPGLLLAIVNGLALIGCAFPWQRSDVARALRARAAEQPSAGRALGAARGDVGHADVPAGAAVEPPLGAGLLDLEQTLAL
jgi:Zn-dependent protease